MDSLSRSEHLSEIAEKRRFHVLTAPYTTKMPQKMSSLKLIINQIAVFSLIMPIFAYNIVVRYHQVLSNDGS